MCLSIVAVLLRTVATASASIFRRPRRTAGGSVRPQAGPGRTESPGLAVLLANGTVPVTDPGFYFGCSAVVGRVRHLRLCRACAIGEEGGRNHLEWTFAASPATTAGFVAVEPASAGAVDFAVSRSDGLSSDDVCVLGLSVPRKDGFGRI